jgi:hypothetical protein
MSDEEDRSETAPRINSAQFFLLNVCECYVAHGEREKTGERRAYIRALNAMADALNNAISLYDSKLYNGKFFMWFDELQQMLADLDSGIVSPVLDCPVRSNALSTSVWMERMAAVTAVEALHYLGMKFKPAARRVLDGMPELKASEKDLLSWRAEFKKGNVNNPSALSIYRHEMEWLQGKSRAEIEASLEYM